MDRLGRAVREWASSTQRIAPTPPRGDRRGSADAYRSGGPDRRRDRRHTVPARAGARLSDVSVAGDAHDHAHRGAVRARPHGAEESGGDARAERGPPRRGERRSGPPRGARTTDAGTAGQAAIVAHVGAQRDLLLVFGGFMSPSDGKERQGHVGQGQGGVRRARRRRDLGDDLGFPVTFMVAWPGAARPTPANSVAERCLYYDGEAASVSACDRSSPAGDGTGATTSARSCAPWRCSVGRRSRRLRRNVDPSTRSTGLNWLSALGALVALSLVVATAVISTRR